ACCAQSMADGVNLGGVLIALFAFGPCHIVGDLLKRVTGFMLSEELGVGDHGQSELIAVNIGDDVSLGAFDIKPVSQSGGHKPRHPMHQPGTSMSRRILDDARGNYIDGSGQQYAWSDAQAVAGE